MLVVRLSTLSALLALVGFAVSASAFGSPSRAAGTPPYFESMSQRDGQLRLKYAIITTEQNDPWVVEVATATEVDQYGAFLAANVVSSSGLIRVRPGTTSISVGTGQLPLGRYYVHAARDFTASYIEGVWEICRIIGCIPNIPPASAPSIGRR